MIKLANTKIVALAISLIVILHSGHALQTIDYYITYLVYIPALIFSLWGVISFACNSHLNDLSKFALIIFVLMLFFTGLMHYSEESSFYVRIFCIIITAFGITRLYSFEKMVNVFSWIMTIVTIIAIIGYYLLNNTSMLDGLPIMLNINDREFGIGYIFNYIVGIEERNCAMFWEPGLFATYLTVAMVFELLNKNKKTNIFRVIIYIWGYITANSSAGFVLLFLCIVLFIIKKDVGQSGFRFFLHIAIVVAAVVIIINFDKILNMSIFSNNEYFQKLATDNVADSSRWKAFEHNFEVFLKDPIFGAGIVNVSQNMKDIADTSTSTYLLSVFGLPAVMYTVFFIIGVFKSSKMNLLSKVVVTIMILIIINKEPHHQFVFTWCMLFYLLKNEDSVMPSVQMDSNRLHVAGWYNK